MSEQNNKKPRGEERKDQNLHIRATKSEMEFLDMACYELDKSKTDVIWKALKFYYNYTKGSF